MCLLKLSSVVIFSCPFGWLIIFVWVQFFCFTVSYCRYFCTLVNILVLCLGRQFNYVQIVWYLRGLYLRFVTWNQRSLQSRASVPPRVILSNTLLRILLDIPWILKFSHSGWWDQVLFPNPVWEWAQLPPVLLADSFPSLQWFSYMHVLISTRAKDTGNLLRSLTFSLCYSFLSGALSQEL